MRDYGKVYSTFWSSSTTHTMSDDAKMMALYLMTCSHSTIAGAYRLPDGYVSEDIGWPCERVEKAFAELFAKGFANRCATTKWVWIVKHLEWNRPENPNQRKSAAKIAMSIPDECGWKLDFMRVCGPSLGLAPDPSANPSGTLQEPFLNQEQEQEQDKPPPSGVQGGKPPRPPDGKKIDLPDWMPIEPWADFVAMRRAKGKRAPFTVAAAKGIVVELGKLRDSGHDPGEVLRASVVNGWSGVFAPKPGQGRAPHAAESFV